MKKLYCLIILTGFSKLIAGQNNLVPNGDFEIYVDCPLWYNDLDSAYAWSNPMTNIPNISGTPDFFHECANYPVGMPSNFQGYQYAHSKWAYAGIYLTEGNGANANHREYLQTYLTAPLIAGNCYHFQMYVNLSNHCRYTTDDIGVKISSNFLSGINNQAPLLYLPSVDNPSTNKMDTLNWTLVEGDYIASGGELYLLIGNFKTDLQTTTVLYNPSSPVDYIYCYIDDVSLQSCSGTVNVNEHNTVNKIVTYPNPAEDIININCGEILKNAAFTIYDFAGNAIFYDIINSETNGIFTFNSSKLKKGLYMLNITTESEQIISRFVKN